MHPTKQPSRPRTMPFSVKPQARTTLFRLISLELAPFVVLVLTWWVFTPSALRLAVELRHARPRFTKALKKSKRFVGTIALLFSLFLASGTKNFLFLPWPLSTADAFDIVCRLDRNATLDEVPIKKKQKAPPGQLLDNLHQPRLCWASLQSRLESPGTNQSLSS